MKRALTVVVALSLVGGLIAAPASAKKKKKKAKPVATTYYMHGPTTVGEVDGANWFSNLGAAPSPFTMDETEPTDPVPDSMTFTNPALNDQCTGLPAAFPSFQGNLAGTIKGDATLTAHFASAPGTIKARIWADVPMFSCNDAYIEPASEVDVELPSGQGEVEIVFPDLNLKAVTGISVEILAPSGTDWGGQVGRLLYDSPAALTRLEFNCIPASGKSCVPS